MFLQGNCLEQQSMLRFIEILGFIGGGLTIVMLAMRTMIPLRVVVIASNIDAGRHIRSECAQVGCVGTKLGSYWKHDISNRPQPSTRPPRPTTSQTILVEVSCQSGSRRPFSGLS
jgi:hypothetical protein